MKKSSLFFLLLTSFALTAHARTFATKACVSPDCNIIEIKANIDAGTDSGMPGAFGVLATTIKNDPHDGRGKVSYWTARDEWVALQYGEQIKPAENLYPHLPQSKEYVIFRGTKEEICRRSRGFGFNLFAWHAALKPSQLDSLKSFMSRYEITGWQADNFMSSALFYEANKQHKVSLIYTVTCSPEN